MKKKYDNILVPYDWYNDLVSELGSDEPNEELAKERLWYLYISDIGGEQVMSGDPAIDYTVQGLLNQLDRMRPSAEGRDMQIAQMRAQGMTSREIGGILGMSDGAVRKRPGWVKFESFL